MGALSFFSIFCVFCSRNYNCRILLYPLWVTFGVLSIAFYLISSVVLFGSFTSFSACQAYYQFTSSPSNSLLLGLSYYNTSQISQVVNTCFYVNKTGTIFNAFTNLTNLPTVQTMDSTYTSSLPSASFYSV